MNPQITQISFLKMNLCNLRNLWIKEEKHGG